jgi:hypothetical protein
MDSRRKGPASMIGGASAAGYCFTLVMVTAET